MKQILLFFTLSLFLSHQSSAQKKLMFQDISLENALEKAKTEGKLVFVDMYTTWCYYCIRMKRETYTRKEVYPYMNDHFISLMIDAETEYGKGIKEKYKVFSYPSFLFLNGDGEVVYQTKGFKRKTAWIREIKKAVSINNYKVLEELEEKYHNDKVTDALLKEIILIRAKQSKKDNSKIVQEWFNLISEEEKEDIKTFYFVAEHLRNVNTQIFDWLMDRYLLFKSNKANEEEFKSAEKSIFYHLEASKKQALEKQEEEKFQQLLGKREFLNGNSKEAEHSTLKEITHYYIKYPNTDKYFYYALTYGNEVFLNVDRDSLVEEGRRFSESGKPPLIKGANHTQQYDVKSLGDNYYIFEYINEIHLISDNLIQQSTPIISKSAIPWLEKAIELYPNGQSYLLLAEIALKNKEVRKAKKIAKKGLRITPKGGVRNGLLNIMDL